MNMKKYFAVTKNKIGVSIQKKVIFNGYHIIIKIKHGFGYVKTDMPIEEAQNVVKPMGITLYNSQKEFNNKIKENLERRKENV